MGYKHIKTKDKTDKLLKSGVRLKCGEYTGSGITETKSTFPTYLLSSGHDFPELISLRVIHN